MGLPKSLMVYNSNLVNPCKSYDYMIVAFDPEKIPPSGMRLGGILDREVLYELDRIRNIKHFSSLLIQLSYGKWSIDIHLQILHDDLPTIINPW